MGRWGRTQNLEGNTVIASVVTEFAADSTARSDASYTRKSRTGEVVRTAQMRMEMTWSVSGDTLRTAPCSCQEKTGDSGPWLTTSNCESGEGTFKIQGDMLITRSLDEETGEMHLDTLHRVP